MLYILYRYVMPCKMLFSCVQDFEVDELSAEYKALHPLASAKQASLINEHFDPLISDEDEQNQDSDDASADSQSEDDDESDLTRNKEKKKRKVPRYLT